FTPRNYAFPPFVRKCQIEEKRDLGNKQLRPDSIQIAQNPTPLLPSIIAIRDSVGQAYFRSAGAVAKRRYTKRCRLSLRVSPGQYIPDGAASPWLRQWPCRSHPVRWGERIAAGSCPPRASVPWQARRTHRPALHYAAVPRCPAADARP